MTTPRKYALVVGLASCSALAFIATGQEQKAKKPAGEETFRIAVDMVSLPVIVTTRDSKRVTDLRMHDFQVFEDGVQQDIAGFAAVDEPISVALVLDTSGSTEQQLQRIQDEAIRFVDLLQTEDSVAILSFADEVKLLENFSIDRGTSERAIRSTRPGGLTALYEAVWRALDDVLKPIEGRKALVLFTDGVDNRSYAVTEGESLELAKQSRAIIYSVYFDTEADRSKLTPRMTFPPIGRDRHTEYLVGHQYLMQLSEYTGGLVFDAMKMEDLGAAFERIARELSCQYSIGYYPANSKRGRKFRRIEVKVNKPGLLVRTKNGYFPRNN